MTAVPKPRKLTEDEYLAIERKAEFRSEFVNGTMIAMPTTDWFHSLIKSRLAAALGNQLSSDRYAVLTTDMRVKVEPIGAFVYPDIVVVSGKPHLLDEHQDVLLNPVVVGEVLSPTTETYDRGAKLRHYRQIPSLKEVVLVAQNEPVIDQFVRQPDNVWTQRTLEKLDDELAFAAVPVRVSLAAIYAGVTFPEAPQVPAE